MWYKMFSEYDYFSINVSEYVHGKNFSVTRPASLNNPKDHSVMFIQKNYLDKAEEAFMNVNDCLIFWPKESELPPAIAEKHAVFLSTNPHLDFCRFFKNHSITNFIQLGNPKAKDGYITVGNITIGEGTVIFPYAYLNGNITIGKNCYIASGVRIIGNVFIGNNVLIKENTVLGADGLTTDRDADGTAVTMPQFGGLIIEDNVQIGANTAIARGAIDNTVIRRGCKIDNCCWVSHNNFLDENVFMVGESTTFGSVTVGKNSQISGNATIRNGLTVGAGALVGAGAVVTRSVRDGAVVSGNPAKEMLIPKL